MRVAKDAELRRIANQNQVPIKNLEFGDKQETPQKTRGATYKLPSYASCLRAQIRPKNYTALKGYYELLAKDEAMAKVNEKKFFTEAFDKLQNRSKRASTSFD